MVNIFILQKISPERDRLQLFCTFAIILDKFSAPMSPNFFLWKIWVITNSRSAANITWWVYWMRNRGLLLPIFLHFFYPVTLLTHSAVTVSRISLGQGNWSPIARLDQWFLSRRWIEEALNRKSTSRLFERSCFLSFLRGFAISDIHIEMWYTDTLICKWQSDALTAVP